jgi:hypothetical protein
LKIDFSAADSWPSLPYDEMAPTVDHLHRLSQIAGKYTLDQPFEAYWGDIALLVTPRGIATRTLRSDAVLFEIEYAILDSQVVITASTGRTTLALGPGTVADFYGKFVDAVAALRIQPRARPWKRKSPERFPSTRTPLIVLMMRPWHAECGRLFLASQVR